jgi:hypothetical protein
VALSFGITDSNFFGTKSDHAAYKEIRAARWLPIFNCWYIEEDL